MNIVKTLGFLNACRVTKESKKVIKVLEKVIEAIENNFLIYWAASSTIIFVVGLFFI